jgi:DNA-binding NarL/FixJ family response regulator
MKNEIRLLIADDHPIFRQGLRQVIEKDPQLKVVAEADDGENALALIRELKPQVAVLDLDMPIKDGFTVASAIREERLGVEIVFLTMHKDEMYFNEALNLGANGYIIKDSAAADVVNCINRSRRDRTTSAPRFQPICSIAAAVRQRSSRSKKGWAI